MVITNSGGAWTTDEFVDGWVFFVGQSGKGIQTYGSIASNTDTTITCSGMIYGDNPTATGTILIYMGSSIEFLADITQPSVVRNLDVNVDCFEYSDNDDKRKLSTKVVATGKDSFGKTISVMLAAVHAYDNDKQFFKDSTIVTRRSEGYVYRNNYIAEAGKRVVTVLEKTPYAGTPAWYPVFTTAYATYPYALILSDSDNIDYFPNGTRVWFTVEIATLPPALAAIVGASIVPDASPAVFYVVDSGVDGTEYFRVSQTIGGDPIDLGGDWTSGGVGGKVGVSTRGALILDNSDYFLTTGTSFTLFGTTAPTGLIIGNMYNNSSPQDDSTEYIADLGTPIGSGASADLYIQLVGTIGNRDMGNVPRVWLYNWNYTIPSGSQMAFVVPFDPASTTTVTTVGDSKEYTDSSGVLYTELQLTEFPIGNFSGRGFLLSKKLFVQNYDYVGNNEVLVGEEKITISSSGNDTEFGNYIEFAYVTDRVTSTSLKCYPHDVGALVARTNYTEASPESTSAIALDGVHIGNFTVDGNISYGALDGYATYMLLGLGNFYKIASTWCLFDSGYVLQVGEFHGSAQSNISRPIEVGDRISTTKFTGDTPEEYEVVEVTIKPDEGRLFLQLGDFEKNVFTSLQQDTTGLNQTLT
jgi:hypothetical protein